MAQGFRSPCMYASAAAKASTGWKAGLILIGDYMSLTPEQRKAYDRERHQKYHAAMMADPVLHEQKLARKRELRQLRHMRNLPMPRAINAGLCRVHGPFAPLFAIQRAA